MSQDLEFQLQIPKVLLEYSLSLYFGGCTYFVPHHHYKVKMIVVMTIISTKIRIPIAMGTAKGGGLELYTADITIISNGQSLRLPH